MYGAGRQADRQADTHTRVKSHIWGRMSWGGWFGCWWLQELRVGILRPFFFFKEIEVFAIGTGISRLGAFNNLMKQREKKKGDGACEELTTRMRRYFLLETAERAALGSIQLLYGVCIYSRVVVEAG